MEYSHKELVARLLADTCEVCQNAGEVQVHHIRKLKDLQPPGPRQPRWTKIMANRRRKTLFGCAACHDDIHTGTPTAQLTQ